MPRAIWKGAIGFGLVTIPISLYPAMRREELHFHMLREKDLSPINYKRVAAADGKEVPWDQIVKGYEYEKGKYVVLREEDFARADVEATQTVDIQSFVAAEEVDPLLFNKPYYMEPGRGGDKAYALLRDSLIKSDKIAIAKVVIKTRQYLAAVRPKGDVLMLELMYFPDELVDSNHLKAPSAKAPGAAEMRMAKQLIDSMTETWDPSRYDDDYKVALEKVIEEKIEHGDDAEIEAPKKRRTTTSVVDLADVLQRSLSEAKGANRTHKPKATKKRTSKKGANKSKKNTRKPAKKRASKKAA